MPKSWAKSRFTGDDRAGSHVFGPLSDEVKVHLICSGRPITVIASSLLSINTERSMRRSPEPTVLGK